MELFMLFIIVGLAGYVKILHVQLSKQDRELARYRNLLKQRMDIERLPPRVWSS